MSAKRELCESCKGLGCFTCGMSGFVKVEQVDEGLIVSVPAPQLISQRQIYSPGTRSIAIEDVELLDGDTGLKLSSSGAMTEHERAFRLRILACSIDASGRHTFVVELVPV